MSGNFIKTSRITMSRSSKNRPTPEPLDLINHIRQCSLEEVRLRLANLRRYYPDAYQVVVDFLLSCNPKKPHGPTE
jgi:hypothetical protein